MLKKKFMDTYAELCPEINALCHPIYELGVQFFSYMRIDQNDDLLYLCTDKQYFQTKVENNLFDYSDYASYLEHYKDLASYLEHYKDLGYKKHLFFGEPNNINKSQQCLYEHGIWNSVAFYFKNAEYIEIFHFGGFKDRPEIINFYANADPIFHRFILYFKGYCAKTIKTRDHLLNLSSMNHAAKYNACYTKPYDEKKIQEFWAKTECDKISLQINDKDVSLSKREFECIQYILRGFRAKDIAYKLDISHRTVEDYLMKIRHKTGYLTRTEMAKLFSNLPYWLEIPYTTSRL